MVSPIRISSIALKDGKSSEIAPCELGPMELMPSILMESCVGNVPAMGDIAGGVSLHSGLSSQRRHGTRRSGGTAM